MKRNFLSVIKCALVLLTFYITQNEAFAASKTWIGTTTTGAWVTGTNWSPTGAPASGDDVTIGGTATTSWNNIPSISLNSLTISGNSSLSFSNATQVTLTVTTLSVNNSLNTGTNVSITIPAGATGTISSGKVLTMGGLNSTLTIGGTLNVNGSFNTPLGSSNAIPILNGGLVNYIGSGTSGPFSPGFTVQNGAELRFSGSGTTGLGNYVVQSGGLVTIGGSVITSNATFPTYNSGSTLQYTGTTAQTANYYELPSGSGGVTNLTINNASGVTFNTSIAPSPTITGILTLTNGVLKLTGTNYPEITFSGGNTPILQGSGSINPGTTSTLVFTGGGAAFALPNNLFTTSQDVYTLTVSRTNPLTLNNQNITSYFFELNSGQVILGTGNYTASSVTTTGTFSTNTMAITSSSSGYFQFAFAVGDTSTRTLPLGETVGTTEYTPTIIKMNATSVARTVGFRLVDGIDPNMNTPTTPLDYTTRYWNTNMTPSTGTYNYDANLYYNGVTGDVVGTEANIAPVGWNGSTGWNIYPGAVNTALHYLGIAGASETTGPFGFDFTGRTGVAALAMPVATAGTGASCTQITANWNASVGATGYFLDVATDNAFTTFVTGYNNLSVGNVTTYNVTGLASGQTYYYRVRATDGTSTSANSATITYATLSSATAPVATAGTNATCSAITANWNVATGATAYFLDVATDNTFTNFVNGYNNLNVGNVTNTTVTGLAQGTTYYYRVRASSGCGTSGNSGTITYATILPTVTPVATAGTGATCTQITANWNAAANAVSYLLDVATDNGFTAFVAGYNGLNVGNTTSVNVTGLTQSTTYYYRVRAANNCDTSSNSGTIIYATITAPAAPVFSSGATSLCVGATDTYTASSAGATVTYTVSGGATINSTTGEVSNVTANFTVVATASNACGGHTASVTVSVSSPPSITVSNNGPICAGSDLHLTATGGTFYNWSGPNGFNNNTTGTPSVTAATVAATGTYNVTVSDANCSVTGSTSVTVNASVVPTVSISVNPIGIVCSGTSVTFTATSTDGGNSPIYQWLVNGVSAGSGSTLTRGNLNDGDSVKCVLTSNANCASPSTVISSSIVMSVAGSVAPSVSITSSASGTICAGTSVVFTANPSGGGNNPTYVWTVDGTNAGTGSTLTRNNLANGDSIGVILTSNSGCATTPTATASIIVANVVTSLTPSVSIAANPNTAVCAGTNIVFTPTAINGGTNPTYQWIVDGSIVATSPTYSSNTLNNGDSVKVILTSNAGCATTPTATSNASYVVISAPVTPSVTIAANPVGAICAGGTNVTFTPTATNDGSNPTYQWLINGVNVGAGPTYSSTTLNNGDSVSAVMTSNAGCVTTSQVASNAIVMSISGTLTPTVTITADPNYIFCSGANVTFNPAPSGGGSNPVYRWYVNGVLSGNGISFSTNTLNNGDQVTAILTSSASCASPDTAVSNTIAVTVPATVTPSVTISESPVGTVCAGTDIVFTPVPVNGGVPTYQWLINGNNIDTATVFSTTHLADGDQVSVIITSNATCTTSRLATSNVITVSITASVTPSVTIAANPNGPICAGTDVVFTASPVNGGVPTYQWWVNGNNVDTGATFNSSTLFNGDVVKVIMTSSIVCATTPDTTSNIIAMTVNSAATPVITQNGEILTASVARSYQWYHDSTVINGAIHQDLTITQNGNYAVQVTDSNGCSSRSVLFNGVFTGIGDVNGDMVLTVYPNPANSELNINLSNIAGNDAVEIKLYDAIGKAVVNEVRPASNNINVQLNTAALPQGLYMLQLKQGYNVTNRKVVIAR